MDGSVLILGCRNLQQQLLAYTIGREAGVACSVIDKIEDIPGDASAADARTLVLMDSADPGTDALVAGLAARAVETTGLVVALYGVESVTEIERVGLLRGVQGFFYRSDTIELLIKGIRTLLDGEVWLPRDVLVQIALRRNGLGDKDAIERAGLTHRELEILSCVGAGHTNDEISKRLALSVHTVKTHIYRIFKKINVNNRFQASLWAAKNL